MKVSYELKEKRLIVYELQDSVRNPIGCCDFNSNGYLIGDLYKKIFELCGNPDELEISIIHEYVIGTYKKDGSIHNPTKRPNAVDYLDIQKLRRKSKLYK